LLHQKPQQSPHYHQQQQQQQQSENESSSYLKDHPGKEFEFEQQQHHSEESEQIDSYGAPLDQPLGSSSSYESYKLVSTTTTTTSTTSTTTTPCPCRYVKKEDEESTEKYKTPIFSETIYYPIITTTTTTTTPSPPRYVSFNDHTGISSIFFITFIYHYLLF
jgi:hypothetical protein